MGGSLRFNGTNYVAVPDSDDWAFGSTDFTVELWANFDVPGGGSIGHPGDIFIGNDEGPGSVRKWFFALGGGNLNFHINSPSIGARFFPLAPFSPTVGQWYHLALTKSGTTYNLFINGSPTASATDNNPVPNANAPLTIGQAENLGFMNGRLDEVTVYNRALTKEEIKALTDASDTGKCKEIQIRPQMGGDNGLVTLTISGSGFTTGSTVRLTKDGNADILGQSINVSQDGRTITATFDLNGKSRGLWDVVLQSSYGTLISIPKAFTVEEGRTPNIRADIIGFGVFRPNLTQQFNVLYSNEGNVNTGEGMLFITGIPKDADVKVNALPPAESPPDPIIDPGQPTPSVFNLYDQRIIALKLNPINATQSLSFSLNIPTFQAQNIKTWIYNGTNSLASEQNSGCQFISCAPDEDKEALSEARDIAWFHWPFDNVYSQLFSSGDPMQLMEVVL